MEFCPSVDMELHEEATGGRFVHTAVQELCTPQICSRFASRGRLLMHKDRAPRGYPARPRPSSRTPAAAAAARWAGSRLQILSFHGPYPVHSKSTAMVRYVICGIVVCPLTRLEVVQEVSSRGGRAQSGLRAGWRRWRSFP